MARNNKKTRIKGLPPKIELDERDGRQGKYPSKVRIASDNRNGMISSSYEDQNTIVFGEETVYYGYNVDLNSDYLDVPTEQTTSLTGSGFVRKGISDTEVLVNFSSSQPLKPFKEINLPEVEGLSKNDPFFTTGSKASTVGGGFSSPLWSKTKIEIDISSPQTSSFKLVISQSNFVGSPDPIVGFVSGTSYPMAYYNFSAQRWEGIGVGMPMRNAAGVEQSLGLVTTSDREAVTYQPIGFSPGITNITSIDPNNVTGSANVALTASSRLSETVPQKMFEQILGAGRYTDEFGFPFAAKYHATSSQLLDMSQYISEPFLLEKVILQIEGAEFTMFDSVNSNGNYDVEGVVAPYHINNFFILNQRSPARFTYRSQDGADQHFYKRKINWTSPTQFEISSGSGEVYIDSIRDIVTFASIATVASNSLSSSLTRILGTATEQDLFINADFEGSSRRSQFRVVPDNADTPLTESNIDVRERFIKPGRDLIIELSSSITNSISALSFDQRLDVSMSAFAPAFYRRRPGLVGSPFKTLVERNNSILAEFGGRNGLGITNPTGRDFLSPYFSTPQLAESNLDNSVRNGISTQGEDARTPPATVFTLHESANHAFAYYSVADGFSFRKESPYLIMPNDKLIIGWQLPIPLSIAGETENYNGKEGDSVTDANVLNAWLRLSVPPSASDGFVDVCKMSFYGQGRIILYGSKVENNREFHDTTNQLLTSNAIHEVIGD